MHAVGSRVTMNGNRIEPYASNHSVARLLPHAAAAQRYLGFTAFPSVLWNAQDTERDLGAVAIPSMEQHCPILKVDELNGDDVARVSLTMDVPCDLSNSSHVDIHDAGPGFAVWTETVPGAAKNWYFVLPNLYGVDGRRGVRRRQFAGVAIELTPGVGISWDGCRVRHCTSVFRHGHPNNHTYGTFCAPKVRVLNFAHSERLKGTVIGGTTTQTAPIDKREDSQFHDPLEHVRITRKTKVSLPSHYS